jgi:type II secretory pathway component PulJ
MDKKEIYRDKIESQLKEWRVKIGILESKASTLSSEAKSILMKEIEELRSKKSVVKDKLNELQKTGEGTWDKMKDGVEKSADELKKHWKRSLPALSEIHFRANISHLVITSPNKRLEGVGL